MKSMTKPRFAIWMTLAFLFMLVIAIPLPAHADNTQQYNKIYLNPFYVNSISAGGSVLFSTALNPPDRISSVTSAIIGFNSQINGQTQNFTLRVNGQACNPSSYAVATAFSTTGNVQFYFDCTARINKAGTYQINLTSSVTTGAITGWLETTYMNNPSGNIKYVGGTDYFQGEKATVFLQLQSPDGSAVNNASCNFDMYNTSNMLATPIFNKQPMLFRGADGIYFYQFSTAGYPEGVYPLDAECVYNYDNFYFYSGVSPIINVTTNSGTFQGGSSVTLNAYDDSLYMEWTSTPNVTFYWTNITNIANITSMDLYWMGEINAIRTITFYAYNSTTNRYSVILGTLTTTAGGGTTTPSGTNDLFSAKVPLSLVYGTNFSVQMVVSGTGTLWVNWLTLKVYKNSTYVTEVKGSSEVHIYSLNITNNILSIPSIPQVVWNYTNRTLTQNITATVNLTQVLTDIAQINETVTAINTSNNQQTVFLTMINTTTTANNVLLTAINNTVTLINNYLNGFITTILNNINVTVTAINGKNYNPTIIVNTTPTFNITAIANVTINTTQTNVIINTTNTTVVINTTLVNLVNTTVVINTTQVNLENITLVINITNTTVVENITNVFPVFNVTNTTVIVNTTQVNLVNTTVIVNTTQVNLENITVVVNTTNTTVVVNTTNTTVLINMTNITYEPVFNVTFIENFTFNQVVINMTNLTFIENITNVTVVVNTTIINLVNTTVTVNQTNTTNIFNYTQNVTVAVNVTTNVTVNNSELLPYLTEINTTTQNTYSYLTTVIQPLLLSMNSTITSIQNVVNDIYNAVISIQNTVNSVFNLTAEINATTNENNAILVYINNSLVPNTVWIW